MNILKKLPWILIICASLAIVIVGTAGFSYYANFHQFGISKQTENWGHLGDFLNVWVSIASLIILSGLTYYLHSIDKKRQIENQQIEDARSRPYIVVKSYLLDHWIVKNIGNGPAMNIYFAFLRDGKWSNPRSLSSLMSGEEGRFDLVTQEGDMLGLQYCDIHGTVYSTLYRKGGVETLSKLVLFLDKDSLNNKKLTMLAQAAKPNIAEKFKKFDKILREGSDPNNGSQA